MGLANKKTVSIQPAGEDLSGHLCYDKDKDVERKPVLKMGHEEGIQKDGERSPESGDEVNYQLIAKHEAHKRIIWACSWNPYGHQFATGSRDKTVKLWTIEEGTSSVKQLATLPPFKESITALSWAKGLLAVGMDNGLIELWRLPDKSEFDAALALRLDPFLCHVSTVHRLAWRTKTVEVNNESGTLELASCGADHSVRVFKVWY